MPAVTATSIGKTGVLRSMRYRASAPADRQRGQILVIFSLSLVVLIGMAGLALDGGSTFAQRRGQQTLPTCPPWRPRTTT